MKTFLLFLSAVLLIGGCATLLGTSTTTNTSVAEATYTSDLLNCVDTYSTRADIDACRAAVNAKWGVWPDAGPDTGVAMVDASTTMIPLPPIPTSVVVTVSIDASLILPKMADGGN